MRISTTRGLAAISLISSVLLFFLASFLGSITIRTAQPNGLAEVVLPYSTFGFFGQIGSAGLFFFAITLLLASFKDNTLERKQLRGSALLSGGMLAILVAGFLILVNFQDEGPRCLGGCPVSTTNYYDMIYISMSIVIIAGFAVMVLGALYLKKGKSGADEESMSKNQSVAFSD